MWGPPEMINEQLLGDIYVGTELSCREIQNEKAECEISMAYDVFVFCLKSWKVESVTFIEIAQTHFTLFCSCSEKDVEFEGT